MHPKLSMRSVETTPDGGQMLDLVKSVQYQPSIDAGAASCVGFSALSSHHRRRSSR
jgi:hypothetical protein